VIFFAMEAAFGTMGVWYLIGLGAVALALSLFMPRGLFGTFSLRTGLQLLPVGYRVVPYQKSERGGDASRASTQAL
jgi:branched-chain amino acid transport system permease protein